MLTKAKISISGKTREALRENLVLQFLKESPGTGKGELRSSYTYEAEVTAKGTIIELRRPARLNKGFDFTVNVPGFNFGILRKTDQPSHDSILRDLKKKKSKNRSDFEKAKEIITRIYEVKNVSDREIRALNFSTGLEFELIVKVIKWLFIEQDVTYWNWSGRKMFFDKLKELF